MSSHKDSTPTRVLVITEKIELPQALDVSRLAVCELDTERAAAAGGAAVIEGLLHRFLDWFDALERAGRALETSARDSQRAGSASGHVRTARQLADRICAELTDAEDALDFHWPTSGPAALK